VKPVSRKKIFFTNFSQKILDFSKFDKTKIVETIKKHIKLTFLVLGARKQNSPINSILIKVENILGMISD
jgi:hypothetical protein